MKKFIIQFALLLIVIFVALFIYKGQSLYIPFLPQQSKFEQITLGNVQINVEVADTQAKRGKGLGGRSSLASDSGMLFIFDREDMYSFWMKGLKFPLDFIWIKGDRIVDITENVSAPYEGQKDEELPIYQSKEPIDKLLEVNAYFARTHNIRVGDAITIQR